MSPRVIVAVCALAGVAPGAAPAEGEQSIAEAARREKERRERPGGEGESAPTYTDADLAAESAEAAGETEGAGEDAAPGREPTDAEEEEGRDVLEEEREERARLEREWRERFARARERLGRAEAASWRTVVRTEYVSGIPVQRRVREQVETEALRSARQALDDLRTQLRRAGYPPGWARPDS